MNTTFQKLLLLLLILNINNNFSHGQSTIILPGNNSSNILTNSQNNGGIELPKLSYSQIQSIQNPQIGTLVYDIDSNILRYFNSNRWVATNESNFYQYVTSNSNDYGKNISFDYLGNLYILGNFSGTINLGGVNLISNGASDIFIAKYDTHGQLLWATSGGGNNEDYAESMVVDNTGKIIITGFFYNGTQFGSDIISSYGNFDVFVTKFNTDGNLLWAKGFGGVGNDRPYFITSDYYGNIYFTGFFNSNMNFAGVSSLNSIGGNDIFYSKLDNNGNTIWAKQFGGTSNEYCNSLLSDVYGNLFLTGSYVGNISQGNVSLTGTGNNSHFFIAKAGSDGNLIWARKGDGANSGASGRDLVFDNLGNITVIGEFGGTVYFDNLSISSNSAIFFAKYNVDGVIQSLSKFGSSITLYATSFTKDVNDNFYITGHYTGVFQVANKSYTSVGNSNAFVVKLNSSGTPIALQCGGVATPRDIAIKNDGSVYIIGEYNSTFTFNSINFPLVGGYECFFLKVF